MKKLLTLTLLFIFLVTFLSLSVNAQPPFQTGSGTVGIDVRSPPLSVITVNKTVTAHTHAFNKSDGLPLDNLTTDCYVHLYDKMGSHLVRQEMIFELDNPFDWALEIEGTNFSYVGEYSFIIQCNASLIGGFASGGFEATTTGVLLKTSNSIIYIGLLGILIFLFVVTLGGMGMLPQGDNRDGDGNLISVNLFKHFKGVFFVIAYLLMLSIVFIGSSVATAYLGANLMASVLFVIYRIMFLMALPTVFIWFVFLLYSLFKDNQMTKMIARGLGDNGGSI